MKRAWVYILKCSDGTYYTGSTTELDARIAKHEIGFYDGYTAARRPVTLKWSAEFPNINEAVVVERQIKGWSRAKKEALMDGNFDLLHALARCKNLTSSAKRQ